MVDLLKGIIPNVVNKPDELLESINQTFYMLSVSGSIAFVLGLILGVVLIVTRPNGILENKFVFSMLSYTINTFRSIPFVILLAALIPFLQDCIIELPFIYSERNPPKNASPAPLKSFISSSFIFLA